MKNSPDPKRIAISIKIVKNQMSPTPISICFAGSVASDEIIVGSMMTPIKMNMTANNQLTNNDLMKNDIIKFPF